MKSTVVFAMMAGPLVAAALLAAQAPAPAPAAARPGQSRPAAPVLVGSIKELMDGIVDPTADFLFDSVSYNITTAGIEETKPTTKEQWAEVRRHALLLAEAANLLKMPGRRVAPDHAILEVESDEPTPEDLTPEQIQALIDSDPPKFARLAQGLTDSALIALRAADAMDVDKLFESGDAIDRACEACHLEYWYPKDKRPAVEALSRRKK